MFWNHNILIIFTFLLLSRFQPLINGSSEIEDEKEFDYLERSSKGPKQWGEINPEWRACAHGNLQSPIDILDHRVVVSPSLGRLKRSYRATHAVLKNRGHDIMLEWRGEAGSIYINGTSYQLKQCHWHSPSEHTFNGSRHQLELHLVHESVDGRIAVVAITYKYGRPDSFLQKLMPFIKPIERGEEDVGIINPKDIKLGSRKYYRYIGSLTVPPCTEGVVWSIVRKVRTVTKEQVRALREAVHDGCKQNSRPVQLKENQTVWFYRPQA
ncbi:alpha carbonic anhydrase 7-like [Aristolochia californica]|uniref:alpha carbonic anhydrase 7-like n=1 Tax=Aristolochia californica TaxID=171875 RepID=UPI0035E1B6CE